MKISSEKMQSQLLAVTLCLLCCLGSLYTLLAGYMRVGILILLSFLVIRPIIGKKYILVNKVQFIVYFIMIFFILRNNPKLKSNHIIEVLDVLFLLTLILVAKYQKKQWIDYTLNFCKAVYLFYAIYTILERFIQPLFWFSVALFPSSVETVYSQYLSGCMPGLTNHYSTNGMLLGVGIVIFGCEMIYYKDKKSVFLFFLMLVALLLTGKRSDIIFTASGIYLAYFCYMSNKKRTRMNNTIGIIILVGLALVIVINYVPSLATFITRFEETTESGDVTLGRTKMWAIAIDCFKENVILGVGWEKFKYRNLHEWHAHNIYVQLLAETGIVGFAVFMYFFISTFICGWRYLKRIRVNGTAKDNEELHMLFALAMQVFFLLYGVTGNPLYDKETYVPYYIACAITSFYTGSKIKANENNGE